MVTRFEAVRIGWEVVKAAGFEPSSDFSRGNDNATVTKLIHEIYEDEGLSSASEAEARRVFEAEITVA